MVEKRDPRPSARPGGDELQGLTATTGNRTEIGPGTDDRGAALLASVQTLRNAWSFTVRRCRSRGGSSMAAGGCFLAREIGAAIAARFGFEPHVAVISDKDLAAAVAGNPFPESTTDSEGRALHLSLLADAPRNINRERLDTLRGHSVRWQVSGRFLYLHAPDGFSDSKLAKQVERILGVTCDSQELAHGLRTSGPFKEIRMRLREASQATAATE